MMAPLIVTGLIIVLFIIVGIVFYSGKGAFLIAGYNTMPQEEKNKIDTVALCKFMGKMMFGLSFSMIFWILSEVFENTNLFFFGLLLFIGIVIFALIYVNTGNRFKK